ncbi:DUF6602 domain-containing protein [Actinomadura bangladeshensis]|uniref:DUF6602 domain-containing protein n=1 Tax=Actinomadura bangladeshensis TaxID=453573 RepID=A0A4R4P981_9ACTN|nr:DUF6602 domain-containing protein [Actinomadura bangladeshensis]TDC17417.1 hypothetical protein E1284_09165 [Actinomadura bangladeshensis]
MNIKHAPTIGDMYEGLSADLLGRAIPGSLGLRIVTGFAADGHGNMSGQLDCMLVRGDGEKLPYTNAYVWHVKDVIAVIEVKKNLYSAELREAFGQLRTVHTLEDNYLSSLEEEGASVDIGQAWRSFAQMTGKIVAESGDLSSLSSGEKVILRTLILEQISSVRIILGLHGFKSEQAFRNALVKFLEENLGVAGFGVSSFPQLIVSGNYSLAKANGRPYSPVMRGEWWPFCFSTPINPLLLLLEFIWTRLDELYGLGSDAWGEDLDIEVARGLLSARAVQGHGQDGWEMRVHEATVKKLDDTPTRKSWSPAFVTSEEFVILSQLSGGREVHLDDPLLLAWLDETGVAIEELLMRLLETRLVAVDGSKLRLITRECGLAILPTGELVAAENNTGRLTRWIEQRNASGRDAES